MYVEIISSQYEQIMKNAQTWFVQNSEPGDEIKYFPDKQTIRYHCNDPEYLCDALIEDQVFDPSECEYEVVF